ncbi:hypothetical protein K8I31_15375 [bacterium]|nr:hypothetical protein [bacterium]
MPFPFIVIYIVVMGYIFTAQPLSAPQVEAFCDGVITLFCLMGAVNLYRVAYHYEKSDSARVTWLLFSLGLFFEGCGYLVYFLYEVLLDLYLTFPQVPDIAIMSGMICYIISFQHFKKHVNQIEAFQSQIRNWIANGAFAALVLLNIIYISIPTISNPGIPLWVRLIFLIYPALDILIAYYCLHLAMAFLSLGASPIARPWFILVCAFSIFLLTDSLFAFINLQSLYTPYSIILPCKGFAYLLISYASHQQLKLIYEIDSIESGDLSWDEPSKAE